MVPNYPISGYATVQRILDDRLEVKLPDETLGMVSMSEVFIGGLDSKTIVLAPTIAYRHPLGIVTGQRIRVVPVEGSPNWFSRKNAVIQAAKSLQVDAIVPATVAEMTSSTIYAISDEGVEFWLDRVITESDLERLFGAKRLSPSGEREDEWLYVRDRVKIRVGRMIQTGVREGRLELENRVLPQATFGVSVRCMDVPVAPRLPIDEVVVISDDLDSAEALIRFFEDAAYSTTWIFNEADFLKWLALKIKVPKTGHLPPTVLCVVSMDAKELAWEKTCAIIGDQIPSVATLLVYEKDQVFQGSKTAIRKWQPECNIIGAWKKDGDLEALNALLFGQSELIMATLAGAQDTVLKSGPSAIAFMTPLSYTRLAEDCRVALEALVEASAANGATAVLFQIHKKTQQVTIVSASGNQSTIDGFHERVQRMHKSPVRDLAIFRKKSDTQDAAKHKARFLWFMDAMGGPDIDLSVVGMRPGEPPGSPFAYAVFLLAPFRNAFPRSRGVTDPLKAAVVQAIETALLAERLDGQAARLRREAERASDYQFMAHEIIANLRQSAQLMERTKDIHALDEPTFSSLRSHVLRSYQVMQLFRPDSSKKFVPFFPCKIVGELLDVCNQLETNFRLVLDVSPTELPEVRGHMLAFETILRNLVTNSIQQIKEYCLMPALFCERDVQDFGELRSRFNQKCDPVSVFLRERYIAIDDQMLLDAPEIPEAKKRAIVLDALNSAICDENFINSDCWSLLPLSRETRMIIEALDANPRKNNREWVVCLILQEVYSPLLHKTAGHVSVHLEIKQAKDGRQNLLAYVYDDGPGIHTKLWPAVFVSGVSTRYKGTGLGLAISNQKANEAGGSLAVVDSFIYGGTVMLLTLPIEI